MLANVRPNMFLKLLTHGAPGMKQPNRAQFCITWTLLGMVLGVALSWYVRLSVANIK